MRTGVDKDIVAEKAAKSTAPSGDYLELYKMLHEERVSLGEETRKPEMSTVTAVAVLYAWLATHTIHGAPWYIGVPLVILAGFRSIVLGERILFIKEYLRHIEERCFRDKSELDGYETYFSEHSEPRSSKWYMHLRYTVGIIWIALLCVTLIAPHFLAR